VENKKWGQPERIVAIAGGIAIILALLFAIVYLNRG
jgi:hypothetical protein